MACGVAPFESVLFGSPTSANSLNITFPAGERPGPYPIITVIISLAANCCIVFFAASVSIAVESKSPSPITMT